MRKKKRCHQNVIYNIFKAYGCISQWAMRDGHSVYSNMTDTYSNKTYVPPYAVGPKQL